MFLVTMLWLLGGFQFWAAIDIAWFEVPTSLTLAKFTTTPNFPPSGFCSILLHMLVQL
jgi:Na+/serine symporter